METRELAKIDLNLLISLQVLLEEQSVSRAAERLFVTQPAMSKTLSRLRALFDDPLFTRSSHGMQPTPRALELSARLQGVLGDISHLVAKPQFDPGNYRGEVTLALSEFIAAALLPELAKRLQEQAPKLSIRAITRVENQLEALALGHLDFAIHIRHASYSDEFHIATLGESPAAILVRDGHPLADGPVTLQRLANFPMIRLYVSDWEQAEIESNLEPGAALRDTPLGSLEISHLLTAFEVLRSTNYFMPGPGYILQNEGATRGITALPTPPEQDASIHYVLAAHRRTANSAMHNWLWELIMCTIRDLRAPSLRKMRQRVTAGGTESSG